MKSIILPFLLAVSILIIAPAFIQAQELNINNLSSVNVDELSDAQIQKFIDKVEASGYDQDQLILMAKSRGMSEIQIQKLKSRISEVKTGGSSASTSTEGNRLRSDAAITANPADKELAANDPFSDFQSTKDKKTGKKIFGHDFFQNSKLTFAPGLNIPTPANYILGPGDELIIDIWGASEQTYQLTISPEGSIRVPNLGPIYVSGLPIEKAKLKVISRLKRIYSTIGRSSHADVSLGQIRSINVHVIGAVNKPGTYTLSSFGTAFNALYSAGGPSEKGSLRKVEVFRARKLVSTLDAYSFLIRGTGENITLQDQDVVIVRPYENRVVFEGEVKNGAIFELLDGETMQDLLLYSGGYTNTAYEGVINLRRVDGNFKTVKSITKENQASFELFNGDEIYVGRISNEFIGRVTVEGPVLNPGEYELSKEMTLLHLLERADGLRGDAFMDRGVIIRQNADFSLSSISFDPKAILNGSATIALQNNDIVKFQSIYDLHEEYHLMIQGEVQRAGKIAYIEGMTVENLIYLAGGFKESASKSFVEVARRINPDIASDVNKSA
jgi:protein involved in polysaccharide export with SLBB domain